MQSITVLTFLLIISPNTSDAFFKRKFNKVKDRAKEYYRKNFAKDKSWQFLGYDPAEYPGTDLKYRQANRHKWDMYYNCLREQEHNLGAHGTPVPEAVLAYEGDMVRFECKICISPKEQAKIEAVEWYFGKAGEQFLTEVVYDEHTMMAPESKDITIYNLKEEHSGQYACVLGASVTVPSYLTVINGTSNMKVVHTEMSTTGPYPTQPELSKKYNLIVDTEWSDWSPCSACGKVGRRHKVGYCAVYYASAKQRQKRSALFKEFKNAMFNSSHKFSFKPENKNESHKHVNVTAVELELLRYFGYGIPCRSHILPKSIRNLPVVKKRQDEVMMGYCKKPCPPKEVFQVKDKDGKVIETANNSAGIYSMMQGLPPVSPSVDRLTTYVRINEKVILICPGNLNSETPILWQIDSKNVVPDLIAKESGERITVTLLDRIVIKKAKLMDTKLYSCWQNGELAGTIRLVVRKKLKLSFNHHLMLLGMIFILSTFIYVFLKAFAGRKYAKLAMK